jgi:lipopolysaccharide export system protein LptA
LVIGFLSPLSAQTMVYLERSETLSFDEERIADAQILRGNVVFRHEDALMFCDSAYFYESTNSLDAFGHVRFVQGDTLRGFGDKLFYNGNTKLARLRNHVRLVHGREKENPTILTTDSLNYDRLAEVAYYFNGGTIRDSLNTLVSIRGNYRPNTSQAVFSKEVVLTNPKFILTSDTLLYNTDTKVADIISPTQIIYEEETDIHSSRGWYNTANEHSMLLDRSIVHHVDGKVMTGDTIFYDKRIGLVKCWGRCR